MSKNYENDPVFWEDYILEIYTKYGANAVRLGFKNYLDQHEIENTLTRIQETKDIVDQMFRGMF